MSVLTIIRNEVEVYVQKVQIKDLNPKRLKSTTWIKEHKLGAQSHVFVVCNEKGEIKFSHPKQKYKIHFVTKSDIKDVVIKGEIKDEIKLDEENLLYEDYYSFPLVDYLEETN